MPTSNSFNAELAEMRDRLCLPESTGAISPAQFRAYFGISRSTAWRMRRAGNYPRLCVSHGGTQRILLSDLAKFLSRSSTQPGTTDALKKPGRPIGSKNRPKVAAGGQSGAP